MCLFGPEDPEGIESHVQLFISLGSTLHRPRLLSVWAEPGCKWALQETRTNQQLAMPQRGLLQNVLGA